MIRKYRNQVTWKLGKLPFVWSYRPEPTNGQGIPDALPFVFTFNNATGTVMQTYNKKVAYALTKAYKKGSQVAGNMNEKKLGLRYAEYFIEFILKSFLHRSLRGMKILEIGCGTGYLLYRLKQKGACVIGVEPGTHIMGKTKDYGIPIVHDFFPSKKVKGKFDAVIASSVLEHINDPVKFLNDIKKYMKIGSKLILSVPDGRPFLKNGDLSLPYHEHWNYFTKDSLYNILMLSGFCGIHIEKGNFGSVLHCWSTLGKDKRGQKLRSISSLEREFDRYRKTADKNASLISHYINGAFMAGQTVGIYVPGRIINILAYKKPAVGHIRFFDDDSLAQGKYFPCNEILIESQDDLIKNPTNIILIMSLAFGDLIKKRLKRILPSRCRIKTCREVIRNSKIGKIAY